MYQHRQGSTQRPSMLRDIMHKASTARRSKSPGSPAAGMPTASVPAAIDFAKPPEVRQESPAVTSSLDNRRIGSNDSSNAQRWFDQNNNNPQQSDHFRAQSNSPYQIQSSSNNDSQDGTAQPNHNALANPMMLPFRGGGLPLLAPEDETVEEYRSVIDDLTVRNKRLKRKLRQYERNKTVDSEKLIEVRMPGLSAHRKRELERTLQAFVRDLDRPTLKMQSSKVSESTNVGASSMIAKPGSSHTSTRFADSGYGSLTTSNQGLSQQRVPQKALSSGATAAIGAEASRTRNRNIQSYLHDIPEGLQPRVSPAVMTEDAKKRAVVSRLEHLFLGRGAAADGHQQPIQQQEVSQSAARADRSAIEARGQRAALEGRREAAIMSTDSDESMEASKERTDSSTDAVTKDKVPEQTPVEQRPTRPLDLDPDRAQDPGENIKYLNHLGFKLSPEEARDLEDIHDAEKGWLYLNLVMNMAQLHTLNATVKLVKEAVEDYSSRFELSQDGRKLRWRNEPLLKPRKSLSLTDPSVMSSHLSSGGYSRKRTRPIGLDATSSLESSDLSTSRRTNAFGSGGRSYNGPRYLSQPGTSEVIAGSDVMDYQSSCNAAEDPTTLESSAWTSSGVHGSVQSHVSRDDGPMIFYKQQNFFTDMTGDRLQMGHTAATTYNVRRMRPLGTSPPGLSRESSLQESSSASVQAAISHASLDVNADANSFNDAISIHSDNRRVSFAEPQQPFYMEASGVGSAYPADNFVMFVTRELEQEDCPPAKRRKTSHLQDISDSKFLPQTSISEEVVSIKGQLLEASALPPAMFTVSEYGSDTGSIDDEQVPESSYAYEEDDDEISEDSLEHDAYSAPGSVSDSVDPSEDGMDEDEPQVNNDQDVDSTGSENESEAGADRNEKTQQRMQTLADARSSQGRQSRPAVKQQQQRRAASRSPSVDLLAHARRAAPQEISKKEREYDAELAERLAEEMPAGSSAATCGGQGGSGCNSPVPEEANEMDNVQLDAAQDHASVSS